MSAEKLIDLTDLEVTDCKSCKDPTRYIAGKSFDIEGPGQIGIMYRCKNSSCRKIRNAKDAFLICSMSAEKERTDG